MELSIRIERKFCNGDIFIKCIENLEVKNLTVFVLNKGFLAKDKIYFNLENLAREDVKLKETKGIKAKPVKN